ncbi:hypothetical protein ACQ4PT_013537 [Festuca glaucescens]
MPVATSRKRDAPSIPSAGTSCKRGVIFPRPAALLKSKLPPPSQESTTQEADVGGDPWYDDWGDPSQRDDSVHGDSGDSDTHHSEDIVVHADRRVVVRGKNMGKGLDRMSREGRLPLEILPGRTRPTSVVIAAKFGTECGVTVRSQMPIFPHWNQYKTKPKLRADFYGKVGQKFFMDLENLDVQLACDEQLMKQQRNQRYYLKKIYFDPFPLKEVRRTSPVERMNGEQWCDLVDSWADPRKQKTCKANSDNRKSVKYPAATGSHNYEVSCNGEEDALELFKTTHISPNPDSAYSDNVKRAIISNLFLYSQTTRPSWKQKFIPTPSEDGSVDEPLSSIEVVHQVLSADKRKPTFLKNIGITVASNSRTPKSLLEVQLEVEKAGNEKLRSAIEELQKSKEAAEAERPKYAEDMQEMRSKQEDMEKKQEESNALLKQLLAQLTQQQQQP